MSFAEISDVAGRKYNSLYLRVAGNQKAITDKLAVVFCAAILGAILVVWFKFGMKLLP